MEKEVIDGAVKICEPNQMKMLDPCFEPWIEHYYKKWKSKELILYRISYTILSQVVTQNNVCDCDKQLLHLV